MYTNLIDYLENTAAEYPSKIAFADTEEELSFGELDIVSGQIASGLLAHSANHEGIMVCMKKSPSEIAAFMGILKAGCFYVPVEEKTPYERLKVMLKVAQIGYLICDSRTEALCRPLSELCRVLCYEDLMGTACANERLQLIRENMIDTDLAYVMFTSGSTGIPKGVAACHRSVIDYTEHLADVMKWDCDTVFGNQTPFSFDASMKEIYGTIKCACSTIIIPRQLFLFPVKLISFLNENQINTICWVVSALSLVSSLNTFESVTPKYIRTIGFGGEVFPVKQYNRWREVLPDARFVNLYGPTEATGVCCYFETQGLYQENETIPIGRPFQNTRVLVLDEYDRQANEGELCVVGTSVTMGYYNDRERTEEAFVQNPLQSRYPELIYRTGDLVKYREDGMLVFVSRKDRQVKHMGHRIELSEIEKAGSMTEGVLETACIHKDGKLLLFFSGEASNAVIMSDLKKKLPDYMLPNRIINQNSLPKNQNGKTDYKLLVHCLTPNSERQLTK